MRRFNLKIAAALLLMTMPFCKAGAQQVPQIRIDSLSFLLDRSSVQTAYIYSADPSTNYFVDSNHLDASWTAAATKVSSLTDSVVLTPAIEGTYVGMVDTAQFRYAFIMFRDNRGVCYVVGNTTHADQGVFGPIKMFAADETVEGPAVALMGLKAVAKDQLGYRYSTFAQAIQNVTNADTITLLDTIRVASPLTIDKSITVLQDGHPFYSTTSDDNSITLAQTANVAWEGNGTDSLKAAKGIFYLQGGSILNLKGVYAEAGTNIVQVADSALLIADNSHFKTPASTDAVRLVAKGNAQVDDVTFEQARNGVAFVSGSTGALTIKTSTVENLMAGCTYKDITGRAYSKSGDSRIYRRTIKVASSALNQGDTLCLAAKLGATTTDTLAGGVVLNMMADSLLGTLVAEAADTMSIVNGKMIGTLAGSDNGAGRVMVSVDTVGSVQSAAHPMTLQAGRYGDVNATAEVEVLDGYYNTVSGNASLKGGYYANRYDEMVPNRFAIVANTGAEAANYPWKIVEGYAVRYMNHDAEGNDTIIVYNTPNNTIDPRYNGTHYGSTDTILLYWCTDSSLSADSRWVYLNTPSVLTSDTTLWPDWMIKEVGQQQWKVMNWCRQLDGSYAMQDSTMGFANPGDPLVIMPDRRRGYHFVGDTIRMDQFATSNGTDTTFNYYFDRDTLVVHWVLDGGTLASEPDSVYLFEQPIVYPDAPVRPGHKFTHWHPAPTTMPAYDLITTAIYVSYLCPVVWTGDATQTYTAQAAVLSAVINDTAYGTTYDATLAFEQNGQSVSEAVNAGAYTVTASIDNSELSLDPATAQFSLVIAPATLTPTGTVAEKRKTYNGDDVALVTTAADITPLGSDDVFAITIARYDDANVGNGKTITAYYSLMGDDQANYTIEPASEVLYTDGEILARIDIDEDFAGSDNGFDVEAAGYCGGDNAGIAYHLVAGDPVDYKLTFSDSDIADQGFANVDWTAIATPGQIDIAVPANAAAGTYTVQLKLRNELGDSTASIPVSFSVKLSKDFARPLFSDVIAVVDTCNCLGGIQWYEDGVAIPGATGYYYQPADHDLSGHTYHFTAYHRLPDGTIQTATSCEQDDVNTYVEEQAVSVSVYPNPTANMATVSIEHSRTNNHTLCLYNAMGVMLQRSTFEGSEAILSLDGLVKGSYTLSVDGNPVRVIKK